MAPADDWVKLRWEKSGRYYEAHLQQDLWGDWVVTWVWGRRGHRLGQVKHVPCASRQEGEEMLRQLDRTRRRRGYRLIRQEGALDLDRSTE
ncbi:MAG TPA: WGR domain-containing protein [Methylothermaceae bacterium]|nr:WGR domain-containing protein [Methylothermaceae bacterium]